jgi:general secretion pathway protein G
MHVLCALFLVLAVALQDNKPLQSRDEILKQDIENAIKKLGSNRGTESLWAQDELVELGRRAVPAVVAELNKKETKPEWKQPLCEILGRIREPNKDAVAALVARLKDTDEYGTSIGSAAARALASIGDESAAAAILDVLKSKTVDTDKVLKYECIRALGIFRSAEAVETLKKALEDKKPATGADSDENAYLIAAAAADALGAIRAQDAADDVGKLLTDAATQNPGSGQSLAFHAARALQRILEHELRGKAEKDEARAGTLVGAAEDVKKTVDAWKAWADSRLGKRNIDETKAKIAKIAAAVEAFKKDQGKVPVVTEYLKKKPDDAKTWPKDGYYQGDWNDAWGRPIIYRSTSLAGGEYDIVSFGKDGVPWGAGDNADLWNHDKWKAFKKAETEKVIKETVEAITKFNAEQGRLPEKLFDLVQQPKYALKNWPKEGFYMKAPPRDGFDRQLKYQVNGTPPHPYDLWSYGADDAEGGTDENEDLWNHEKPAKKEEPKKEPKKDEPKKDDKK